MLLAADSKPFVFDFFGGFEIPFDIFVTATFIAVGCFVFFFILAIIFSAVFGSKKKAYKNELRKNKRIEKTILEKGGVIPAKKKTVVVEEDA